MLGGAGVHMRFIYFSLTEQRERVKKKKKETRARQSSLKGAG